VGENYTIEAVASGFGTTEQSGITLTVDQVLRVDLQLRIGSVEQKVEVSARPVQVETASVQLGDVIGDRKISALPLNGRSYIDLLGIQAGVTPVGTNSMGAVGSGNLSVNGLRENANGFYVNVSILEESRFNGASLVPTLDSIEEFRLLTNSFDAEYGHFGGSIVNVVTKSGHNEFHGNLYEFLQRNSRFTQFLRY
jgi:hypothetical protein